MKLKKCDKGYNCGNGCINKSLKCKSKNGVQASKVLTTYANVLAEKDGKYLGGSTGAKLISDSAGNKFVKKRGASPEHIANEILADSVYRAAGFDVPNQLKSDGTVKVAEYLANAKPLGELNGDELEAASSIAAKAFAMDALLANWDVLGADGDNMLYDAEQGKVYRIDNGGALSFRAQGKLKKPEDFLKSGEKVGELESLRGLPIYKNLTDEDIAKQIRAINVPSLLSKIDDAGIKSAIVSRLKGLNKWADSAKSKDEQIIT